MTEKQALSKLKSRAWRLSHLYKITTKDGKAIVFKPNQAQQKLFDLLKQHNRIIILKSRQLGITTGVTTYFLDEVLFNQNYQALSIMHTRDHAIAAFDGKVRYAWDNFDKGLRDHLGWSVDTERASQLKFGFGDDTFSSYTVSTSGRSGTFQRVHVSEFGTLCADRPGDAKEVITGTFPAVPNEGKIIIESTANGEIGSFVEMWHDAIEGKNNWFPVFFNWRYDTEEIEKCPVLPIEAYPQRFQELAKLYQLTEKELSYYHSKWLLLNRDWSLFYQEYPTTAEDAFQGSGEKLFDIDAIREYEKLVENGIEDGNSVIHEVPKEGHKYVMGVDPSEGVGGDDSAIVIWDLSAIKPKCVLTWKNNKATPDDVALIAKEFAERYNKAVVAVERNNTGHAVLSVLRSIYDEKRLYRETDTTRLELAESTRYGFRTTQQSKSTILGKMVQLTRDRDLIIPSKMLVQEMRICPQGEMTRTSASEETSRHFDLLMAASIGIHAQHFATNLKIYTGGKRNFIPGRPPRTQSSASGY